MCFSDVLGVWWRCGIGSMLARQQQPCVLVVHISLGSVFEIGRDQEAVFVALSVHMRQALAAASSMPLVSHQLPKTHASTARRRSLAFTMCPEH